MKLLKISFLLLFLCLIFLSTSHLYFSNLTNKDNIVKIEKLERELEIVEAALSFSKSQQEIEIEIRREYELEKAKCEEELSDTKKYFAEHKRRLENPIVDLKYQPLDSIEMVFVL